MGTSRLPLPNAAQLLRSTECSPDLRHRRRQVPHYQPRVNVQHTVTCPPELSIAPSIGTRPLGVIAAIHFDDELRRGRHEIDDAFTDDDLATKRYAAQATASKRGPELLLRRSWR